MTGRASARRNAAAWLVAFLLVAASIVGTGFTSADPDSALYAGIASRLAEQPVSRWVAPEWWGFWPEANLTGLFQEHPGGVFLLPAALGRLGVPAEQAAYVVGVGAGLVALLLLASLAGEVGGARDARATLLLLQVMPVAFIFRVRANHEYPMLVCLLLTVVGLQRIGRSWWWAAFVAVGLAGGLLIKGVFVSLILLAAVLWMAGGPVPSPRARRRAWIALGAGLVATGIAAIGWDAWYVAATDGHFWPAYWARQLGSVTVASPAGDLTGFGRRLGFYALRLLWHPAPWSLALVWIGWRHRRLAIALPADARRAATVAVIFAVLSVLALSLPSRFAERYAFSPVFAVGAVGAVAAVRAWPALAAAIERADARIPALPALLWTGLALSRLALGPLLPRL